MSAIALCLLKNYFCREIARKVVCKWLIVRSRNSEESREITALVPFSTGSKIRFLMPGCPRVRLDNRGFEVFGSCAECALAWTSHTLRARVPHSEHLYAK